MKHHLHRSASVPLLLHRIVQFAGEPQHPDVTVGAVRLARVNLPSLDA
jgi:hypothetical protein